MPNKYQKHSKARLTENLRKNMKAVDHELDDILDNDHKETINQKLDRASRAFAVAKQMYATLHGSDLDGEGRMAAMQLLMALQGRRGGRHL